MRCLEKVNENEKRRLTDTMNREKKQIISESNVDYL